MNKIRISIIITAKSEEEILIDINRLLNLTNEHISEIEVICSFGVGPAKQRNMAIKDSSSDWVYIIDNDSIVDEQTMSQFVHALEKFPDAIVVGGPSVLEDVKSDWQKAIQVVFSSDFGIGPIKSRYQSFGQTRLTSDKELILCNLFIKRKAFLELNGFNEELYPNEENEFLSRVSKKGKIVYAPQVIVYRKHRETISDFFLQMFSYGKGRTRHLLFSKSYNDYIYFIPAIFILGIILSVLNLKIFKMIITLYSLVVVPTAIINLSNFPRLKFFINIIIAFIICHFGYALGLLGGFFERKIRNKTHVTLKHYK